jgi:hypothetical protein
MNDGLALRGHIKAVLTDEHGRVKQVEETENLITNVGRNAIVERLDSSPGTSQPTHMAIGTGTNAAAAGDTALQTELDRNALTSNTSSANVLTMVGDWAAGDGTGTITEAGVFNAASGPSLYSRAVFGAIAKAAGDTLSITWTYTLSVA